MSVEAVQVRSTSELEVDIAVRLVGAVGGVVSVELFPEPPPQPANAPRPKSSPEVVNALHTHRLGLWKRANIEVFVSA